LAIEANSRLLTTLQKNRDQNNCHFTILNAALAYDTARVQFHISDSALGGSTTSTTSTESIVVPSITLKQSLEHAGFDRTNLICDIEGQEVDLVQREGDILQRHVAWLFVEMHPGIVGLDQIVSTTEDLKSLGFQLVESFGSVQAYCNESIANV
jgi:FkbM family methyltransferase